MTADIAALGNIRIVPRHSGVGVLIRQRDNKVLLSWAELIPFAGAIADAYEAHRNGTEATNPTVGHQPTNQAVNVAPPHAEKTA